MQKPMERAPLHRSDSDEDASTGSKAEEQAAREEQPGGEVSSAVGKAASPGVSAPIEGAEAVPASFEALFEAYYRPLASFLFRMLNDIQLAQDITQDCFVKLHLAMKSGQSLENVRAWLYRVATNAALDERRRRRRITWLPLLASSDRQDTEYLDPEDQVALRDRLQRALEGISPNLTVCLLLHLHHGFSHDEIAAILGISSGAARTRLQRGREAFKARWLALEWHGVAGRSDAAAQVNHANQSGDAGARGAAENAGTRFPQAPAAKGAGLVLMFDEFQIIEERRAAGALDKDIYWVLRADIQEARHIDFILAGTMRLEEIVRQHDAALFGIGPTHILRSLEDQNARRLIREPVRDQDVIYDDDAVDLIIALSSSYPYYVQLLCSVLFNYLNDHQKRRATRLDVERVLPTVLEEGSTQFTSILFANDVSSLERYILAGAAELITTLRGSCHRDQLLALLSEKKLVASQTEFEQAIRQLTLRDLMKDGGGGEHIAFQVDLFRQWMRDQKRLDRVVREERERQQHRRM
jgi:RNA polymerase sigma-70 factor (ECF subfamily)